jgi:hypothetical protein
MAAMNMKYEKPKLIQIGTDDLVAEGLCSAGTAACNCTSGNTARSCSTGSGPGSSWSCRPGTAACGGCSAGTGPSVS